MPLNSTLPSPIVTRKTKSERTFEWWNPVTASIWETTEVIEETTLEYHALTYSAADSGLASLAGDGVQVVLDTDNRVVGSYKLTKTEETKTRTFAEV